MPYRFRDYELDPLRYQMTRRGETIDIPRRIFELILLLVRHRDRPVTKEEIMATIWHGRTVTDASLTHAVATARKALGDSPKSQDTIKTVHKRGYWWVAETVEASVGGPVRFSLSSMPFVGRSQELRAISNAIDECSQGNSSLLLITGEAGIGKTRLIAEALLEARARHLLVVEASCLEHEGAPPGFPWVQITRQCLQILSETSTPREPTAAVRTLARAFPELAEGELTPSVTPPSRYSILEQLWSIVSSTSLIAPTVLAIDDLHRADDLSLSALRFFARQLGRSRLLILGAARNGVGGAADAAISELLRHPRSAAIPLGSLMRRDVSILIEGADLPSPSSMGDSLFERSGGNPFFVSQLLSALLEKGGASDGERAARLPQTLRDAVLKQVDGLQLSTREALGAAATIGRSFEPPVVAAVIGADLPETLDALDEAERRGVIEDDRTAPGSQRFRHLILKDAIYGELSRSKRADLHLRIAESLASRLGAEPAAIAHHLRAAYPLSTARDVALAALSAARKAAIASSFLDAEFECSAALDAAGATMTASDRCDLLLQMASAQLRGGRRQHGRLTLREAAALARAAGSKTQTADVALAIAPGFFAIETGTVDPELIEALEEALAAIPERDSAVRVRLLGNLCAALYWSPFSHRIPALVSEAETMAARLSRRDASAHAIGAWFAGLWTPQNLASRRERCQDLLDLAEASGDEDLRLMARVFRIAIFLEASDSRRVALELGAYERLVQETSHPHGQWYVPMYRSMLAITYGDFPAAHRHMAEFVSKGSQFEDANVTQTFLLQSAEIAWQSGRAGEIVHAVEENVARNPILREWQCALAFALAASGREQDARSVCRQQIKEWGEPHASRMNAPIGFAALAETCWLLDDGELAASLEAIAPRWVERTIVAGYGVLCWGSTSRGMGHLAACQGRLDDAEALYREALASEDRIGAKPWSTRTTIALARCLDRRGDAASVATAQSLRTRATADAARLGLKVLPIEE